MRPSMDPLGGVNTLIDKMIGNAYEIVKYVACNIKEIRYVCANMEDIHTVATYLQQNTVVKGVAPPLGSKVVLPFPEDVLFTEVMGSSVIIAGIDNKIYGASPQFTWEIAANGLHLTVAAGAPAGVVGGEIRWLLTHQEQVPVG